MLDILGFLIQTVERYLVYFIIVELLFEFLSFDGFKIVKIVERNVCSHGDDAPEGRMCRLRRRAAFLGHFN